jgi:hypothetical protein
MGIESEPSRATSLLRRYENACWRKLVWAENRLVAERNDREEPAALTPAPVPVVAKSPYVSPGPFFGAAAPEAAATPVASLVADTASIPVADTVPAAPAESPTPGQPQPRRAAVSEPKDDVDVMARVHASLSRLPARYRSDDDLEIPGVKAYSAAAAEASLLARCSSPIRLSDALTSFSSAPTRQERRAAKRESARGG